LRLAEQQALLVALAAAVAVALRDDPDFAGVTLSRPPQKRCQAAWLVVRFVPLIAEATTATAFTLTLYQGVLTLAAGPESHAWPVDSATDLAALPNAVVDALRAARS
jgi:hypothetical protein